MNVIEHIIKRSIYALMYDDPKKEDIDKMREYEDEGEMIFQVALRNSFSSSTNIKNWIMNRIRLDLNTKYKINISLKLILIVV